MMDHSVILLRGLPASGKTTYAKKLMEEHPGKLKRISRSEMRDMLDFGRYNKENEQFILAVRDRLIIQALEAGYGVIVDDTNLAPEHVQAIRDLVVGQATVGIKDFTDVPLEECIRRDKLRQTPVGEQVIRKMHNQHLYVKPEPPAYIEGLPDVLICDIDGTLALPNGRNPYDASLCEDDLVNPVIWDILAKGYPALLVTGRSEKHRPQTERWLKKHGIGYARLFMRQDGDSRKDTIVKQEIYQEHIVGQYNVKYVLEDRAQMVAAYRALGLTVLQVADGDY